MIHPEVRKLLQEVFAKFSEEEGKRAGAYPEVYLVSLLERIKGRLPNISAMLYSTVEMAGFGADTKRFNGTLAKVKTTENPQRYQTDKKQIKLRHLEKVGA
ncbi:MAG: hypothetical protein Q8R17_01010 [bacterium]|nr:hypothetical protein [bacterium]